MTSDEDDQRVFGEVKVSTPRDYDANFEPVRVPKRQAHMEWRPILYELTET